MRSSCLILVVCLAVACSSSTGEGNDASVPDDGGGIASDGGGGGGDAAATCSAANCAGCCFNGACQSGNTGAACGKGGIQCVACAPQQICKVDQICAVDPESRWKVQPASATLATTNNGSTWDAGGGAPDPFVSMWCPATAATVTGTTPAVSDSFTPTWSTGGCIIKAKDLLASGYAAQVFDEDVSFNDPASVKFVVSVKESDLLKGDMTLSSLPNISTMRVLFQKQ
jgi:hypothetical protein